MTLKRKWRWTFQAKFTVESNWTLFPCEHIIPETFIKIHTRPSLTNEGENVLNESVIITIYDIDKNTLNSFYSIWDANEPLLGSGTIKLYDGIGTVLETWDLTGLSIRSIESISGVYCSHPVEEDDIDVKLDYKNVIYTPAPPLSITTPTSTAPLGPLGNVNVRFL